ncbi:hypothetical protein COCC4DRAFT_138243 [Bipolaris maydis ATCC 48331]|uniref:Uncharacterized protein n=2 Tax=Cochliobolus heterostrophus TaxID=5016 RepID=M2TRM5_COCH5|nr:uncharacterized protein COCC4DRAFT_138243 [Bipolaris maydis ATCC 48331]EMD89179.1 hypothetical protein COCHEDRAFT_1032250 [Bipolaris maydis C5]ENI05102.1 hypothetical protein COCC4DRAFT_138243 [Bipolaris maydis ATCC 48331]
MSTLPVQGKAGQRRAAGAPKAQGHAWPSARRSARNECARGGCPFIYTVEPLPWLCERAAQWHGWVDGRMDGGAGRVALPKKRRTSRLPLIGLARVPPSRPPLDPHDSLGHITSYRAIAMGVD